ncbi:hypothetical protein V6N13_149281 [Hibiscus sabdariffa]
MTLEDVGSGPNGLNASDGDANSGLNADDGPFNKIAGENNYETDGYSSGSDWLGGESFLSDDEDEEIVSIKNRNKAVKRKIKSKTILEEDLEHVVFNDVLGEDDLGATDTLREDSEGDSSTEYLESSDAGSYETDSEVAHRFDFKYVSNRKEKIRVVCKVKGCPFMLHASWDKSDGFYKIKTLVVEHQCSVTFKNKRADFRLVGKHFLSKLRIVPNLKLIEMIKLAREELSVEINKDCCQKAKKWALEQIRGSVMHEFNRLFDYMYVLRSADPNGNFELMGERPTVDEKPKFRRLYVCFSALKEAFKKYCRQVISLDGCFLKGSFQGEILSAVGRDSNDQIFPIAWAVVEVENRDTWAWFLNNIRMDLELENGEKVTLISDMQKRSLYAYQMWSTDFVLGICMPIGEKKHKGGDLQMLFWSCCKATTQPQFNQNSARIGELKKKAYDDLMLKDPIHWSKAFFSSRSKCDAVDNNFSEAFNSAILGARFKSVISLFENIRHYVMHRLVEHKRKSLNWKGELCPRIEKKLEKNKANSSFCHVIWNGADGYEVLCNQDTFVVDVKGWKCTCRGWDLTGIPCSHAVCVILYREEKLENYVLDSYKKHVYHELYNDVIPTIPSEKFWENTQMGSVDPPLKRKFPGRPKLKRRREEGEVKNRNKNKLSKKGMKMSCRLCGFTGHNVHEEAATYDFGPSIPATTSASSQPVVAPNQPIPIDPSIPATTSTSSQPVVTSSQPTLVTQLRRSAPKWKITANRTLELVREALDLE